MASFAKKALKILNRNIDSLAQQRTELNILRNADTDFTRNRKLTFPELIKTILFMSSKPLREELLDIFDYDANTITTSGFVQARDKLLPGAFTELFKMMNKSFPCKATFNGYHLIAVDGSDLAISVDPHDTDTYKSNGSHKATSHLHINSAYNILEKRYVDMEITGIKSKNEQRAMCNLVARYDNGNAIFIADRNYATWNIVEHIKKANQYFLIRCKDIHSASSLLRKFNLPDGCFDVDVETILTTEQSHEIKANPDKYRFLSTTSTFDFMDDETHQYPINFRVVRFEIGGEEGYESIITNLPREAFSPDMIRDLYGIRWNVEVSFRHLKYAVGLQALNSKKRNSILQEIWASAILYNLSTIISTRLAIKKGKSTKWEYMINLTRVIHLIRNCTKRKGGIPPDLESIIIQDLLPIRPGRKFNRIIKKPGCISMNYRFA